MTSVTASEIGNFLKKVILCMILDLLNHCMDLAFVDKYIRHVNQLLFCKKINICSRRSQNSEHSDTAALMPRKKRSALASSENGKKSSEEERPKKRMRIDHDIGTAIASASSGDKEVC